MTRWPHQTADARCSDPAGTLRLAPALMLRAGTAERWIVTAVAAVAQPSTSAPTTRAMPRLACLEIVDPPRRPRQPAEMHSPPNKAI